MNISSAPLAATPLFTKDPVAGSGPQKSPLASLLENKPPASTSKTSGSGKDSAPGLDVAEKLKALGEQFLAIMLITDPVQRAKAAADLYKQLSQTAKEYAGATADGRAAAALASSAAANPAAPAADDASAASDANAQGEDAAAGSVADGGQPVPAAPAPIAATPDDAADPTALDGGLPPLDASTPPAGASSTPAAPPVTYMPGKKSNFVADVYMEQIKTFASAAQQVYKAAVEEARHKHADKSRLHNLDDGMKEAKKTLTEAAKAVEGPAATADGYDPTAMAISSPSAAPPSLLDLTA